MKPKLRFPEFIHDWRIEPFSKNIKLLRGSSPRPIVKYRTTSSDGVNWIKIGDTDVGSNVIANVSERITKEGSKKSRAVFKGDIILANSMSFGKSYLLELDGFIYDGWFVLREFQKNYHKGFLLQLLNSASTQQQYQRLSAGGVVQNISSDIVYSILLPKPEITEQEKIASFLSVIDRKINLLSKKKQALEGYKQGLMQKIFSQELRFKREDGTDFPEWETYIISELGDFFNGLTGKNSSHFGHGESRYVQYTQVFRQSHINLSECDNVLVDQSEKQNKLNAGDALFTTSSEVAKEVAYSSLVLEQPDKPTYLNSFCFGLRLNDKMLPSFAQYLFRAPVFRKSVFPLAQGSTRYNVSKNAIGKLALKIPKIEEQMQVAETFKLVDTQIHTVKNTIDKMELFKSGLLQQMFV